MRIFVTGATGNIGSAVVTELLAAGHRVVGLSRSREKAEALAASGAEVYVSTLENLDGLQAVAASADAVIHLAFNHDFSRFKANCEDDRAVISALALGLAGSDRPLVVTSGTPIANSIPGQSALEGNPILSSDHHPRAATEEAAQEAAALGGNVSVVRLPQVHDQYSQGLISPAIGIFRAQGTCVYVGDGQNRWPAAHRLDVARLYRLAVERAEPNAKYHAVAEDGVTMRAIAETVAARLALPVRSIAAAEVPAVFGWLAMFAGLDMPASSEQTRRILNWHPSGPALLDDLKQLVVP